MGNTDTKIPKILELLNSEKELAKIDLKLVFEQFLNELKLAKDPSSVSLALEYLDTVEKGSSKIKEDPSFKVFNKGVNEILEKAIENFGLKRSVSKISDKKNG